ncbi:MAG: 3,4-dihydroxy-2-butanone-4-phosphate synthase [Phycisphaerales bacterium]|nr:3,4-dihydroxy-2-butanone-4-phosphate synthase [Phycisphaerales bacterium]
MFAPIPQILTDLRDGRMVVLTDDEHRENEGDLVLPAQFVTPEAVNFMLSAARGYLCLSMTEADCDRLQLHPQSTENTTHRGTAFTVSVDGHPRHGFTTGVSAHERARTIRMMIDPAFGPGDFVRPGHINPLRSRDGGVLVRTGQTEGSLDLCRLAGLYPAAAIIEVMRDDGEMARVPDLAALCERHGLRMCSVAQIIAHRLARETLVRRLGPAAGRPIRTPMGDFTLIEYHSAVDPLPHWAFTVGAIGVPVNGVVPRTTEPALVRVHRAAPLADLFGDRAAGGDTLRAAMRQIASAGRGAVVYLRHDAPVEPSAAPEHADSAAERQLGIGSQILRDLGLSRLRLLTNHQTELPALDAFGLEVVERVGITASLPSGEVIARAPRHRS